jgi:hypothetical protein
MLSDTQSVYLRYIGSAANYGGPLANIFNCFSRALNFEPQNALKLTYVHL